jgi:hypothetical protein
LFGGELVFHVAGVEGKFGLIRLAEVFDININHRGNKNNSRTQKHKVSVAERKIQSLWRQYRVRNLTENVEVVFRKIELPPIMKQDVAR